MNEFSRCETNGNAFDLHMLFKLDDLEHFNQCIADVYRFDLYDVFHCDFMKPSCKHFNNLDNFVPVELKRARTDRKRTFDVFHVCKVSAENSAVRQTPHECHVRAVATTSHSDIVLDSGSDVTLLPVSMSGVGTPSACGSETFLRCSRKTDHNH